MSDPARLAGRTGAYAVAAAAAFAALGLTVLEAGSGPRHTHVAAWLAVTVAIALTEMFPVHFEHRRETLSISLSTIAVVIGLFTLSPLGVLAARLTGSGIVLVVHRRQSVVKLVVNLASFWTEAAVAIAAFELVGAGASFGYRAWAAAFAAALLADASQTVVLVAAISVYQRRWERDVLSSALIGSAAVMADTCVALVAVTLLRVEPAALALLAVVAAMVLASYRTHRSFREKHSQLEDLYAFTSRVGEAVLHGTVSTTLLDQAREMMRAERSWLCVATENGLVRVEGDAVDEEAAVSPASDLDRLLHAAAHGAGRAELVAPAPGDGGPDSATLVAPLTGSAGPIGTLVVTERSGAVRPFDRSDLHLFVTIANHVCVALENTRLMERLRVQAEISRHASLHDALTGLPNRTLFSDRLEAGLAGGARLAVLLLDLDRFKEVNDTLGHHNGDELLRQVGDRLHSVLRQGDMVARFGGDEFAVLLPDVASPVAAVHVANAITAVLEDPFAVADVSVDVGASIGIALAPDDGADVSTLVQRADVAMYTAKAEQSNVALYEASRDNYSADRLRLVADLRRAISHHELDVHYQPQVDLASGRATGIEALVRWTHPERGPIPPDQFVPVAEYTGQIRQLTLLVLDRAVADCAALRRRHHELRVSVNLSARSLLQPTLVDDVAEILERHHLPAPALCLELTEGSIVADFRRSLAILQRLRDMGITIAVDDFGTGQSSLAYLQRLPIGEIKVDKSFVLRMHERGGDRAIVRTVVDLARNLGLPVVAEGVETEEAADHLHAMGCDAVQGYLYSRPVPVGDLMQWLESRTGRAVSSSPRSAPRRAALAATPRAS